ncbi:glycosyltransferase [Aeromicrobium panaciterrae]|uniref:glycosyltransferase n=1 Tax=Aeromicrobium panaciterrae TaxID=363861 RepID=UPI0031DBB775
MTSQRPTVAIAHDYLTQRGGAERVVLAMAAAFPEAPIYTTLYEPRDTFPEFGDLTIKTSWLNRIRLFRRHHRLALPFLPLAASSTRIDADVVLVSSSGWAHGFRTPGRKVVYCYSPARWLYQSRRYLGDKPSFIESLGLWVLRPLLIRWDRRAARSAHAYVAISSIAQDRILIEYDRSSVVIPAPRPNTVARPPEPMPDVVDWLDGDAFELCISRLLPYKNVSTIVEAYASEPRRKLVIVGKGPQADELRAMATDNVRILESITDGQISWLYRQSRALVAISYEDFGLTPLEAASFGKPSLVLRWGGYIETMVDGVTAVFIPEPTVAGVREGLSRLDSQEWDESRITEHADRYAEEVFVDAIRELVKQQSD